MMTASEFINYENNIQLMDELSDIEVFDRVKNKEIDEIEETEVNEDKQEGKKKITYTEAAEALNIVINYVEDSNVFNEGDSQWIIEAREKLLSIKDKSKNQASLDSYFNKLNI